MNRVKLNTIHLNEIALNKRSLIQVGVVEGHAHGEYFCLMDCDRYNLKDSDGYELIAQ